MILQTQFEDKSPLGSAQQKRNQLTNGLKQQIYSQIQPNINNNYKQLSLNPIETWQSKESQQRIITNLSFKQKPQGNSALQQNTISTTKSTTNINQKDITFGQSTLNRNILSQSNTQFQLNNNITPLQGFNISQQQKGNISSSNTQKTKGQQLNSIVRNNFVTTTITGDEEEMKTSEITKNSSKNPDKASKGFYTNNYMSSSVSQQKGLLNQNPQKKELIQKPFENDKNKKTPFKQGDKKRNQLQCLNKQEVQSQEPSIDEIIEQNDFLNEDNSYESIDIMEKSSEVEKKQQQLSSKFPLEELIIEDIIEDNDFQNDQDILYYQEQSFEEEEKMQDLSPPSPSFSPMSSSSSSSSESPTFQLKKEKINSQSNCFIDQHLYNEDSISTGPSLNNFINPLHNKKNEIVNTISTQESKNKQSKINSSENRNSLKSQFCLNCGCEIFEQGNQNFCIECELEEIQCKQCFRMVSFYRMIDHLQKCTKRQQQGKHQDNQVRQHLQDQQVNQRYQSQQKQYNQGLQLMQEQYKQQRQTRQPMQTQSKEQQIQRQQQQQQQYQLRHQQQAQTLRQPDQRQLNMRPSSMSQSSIASVKNISKQFNSKPNNAKICFIYGDKKSLEVPECCICMNDFKLGDKLANMICRHIIHKSCIEEWSVIKRECPLCKSDI